MKIAKRIPFGFRGDWGKVYKRYTTFADLETKTTIRSQSVFSEPESEEDIIKRYTISSQNNRYVDIGQDVQFKRVDDISASDSSESGLVMSESYTTVATSDARFNETSKKYVCIVESGDIVVFDNCIWQAASVRTVSIYNPKAQDIYYIELSSLL